MGKIAKVTLDGGYNYKKYNFMTDIEGLVKEDKVVVDTVNGLFVGTFQEYGPETTTATKWVIQKVDMSEHEARKEKAKQLKELKKKMDERRKKIQELEIYEILAGKDEELAVLLADYKTIKGDAE